MRPWPELKLHGSSWEVTGEGKERRGRGALGAAMCCRGLLGEGAMGRCRGLYVAVRSCCAWGFSVPCVRETAGRARRRREGGEREEKEKKKEKKRKKYGNFFKLENF
jgi:hypothetical protein